MNDVNDIERKMYSLICRNDGIKAREIARDTGVGKTDINRLLYGAPFIHDLCYQDEDHNWYGLIRQMRPHAGIEEFCGYYGFVDRFIHQDEEEWLDELTEGCRHIGRNLNDTRGLIHSFKDTREVMIRLFQDLDSMTDSPASPASPAPSVSSVSSVSSAEDFRSWEICFELRIKRARYIRIYADVLVITDNKVFSLEFKMKNVIDPEEQLQAVKYAAYLEVIFGPDYEVVPALVLTRAEDLYTWYPLPESTAELPVCSGDMLFNLFDEYIGFLK